MSLIAVAGTIAIGVSSASASRIAGAFLLSLILVVALLATVSPSQAQIITLTDNNSVAQIDPTSQLGMFNWTVNGQNSLSQQWFWYRVGATGPEQSIDAISAPTISTPDSRTLNTSYSNGSRSYGVAVHYQLTGSALGSQSSRIDEGITITNPRAVSLDFHLFQYSDFDLGGTAGGDTVRLMTDGSGKFVQALQTDGIFRATENSVTPGADHGEAGLFNATLVRLNDGLASTLNDNPGPVGPGDATWALEWDLTIAPFGTASISMVKTLAVPEPSALALAAFGLIGLAAYGWRRRRLSH